MSENIATTRIGSHMYGLATATSDIDLLTVTSDLTVYSRQRITGDHDERIISAGYLVSKILDSQPVEVDIVRSRGFAPDPNHPVTPYILSARFNPLTYMARAEAHARECLTRKDGYTMGASKRGHKNIRTAARTLLLLHRVAERGRSFTPEINREAFNALITRTYIPIALNEHLPRKERADTLVRIIGNTINDMGVTAFDPE